MTALLGTSSNGTPAVEGDNTGGGYGLKGVSNGTGVYAQTTGGSGYQGLYANSTQASSWAVYAESPAYTIGGIAYSLTNGIGVYGANTNGGNTGTGNSGVYGVGNNYGVYGTTSNNISSGSFGGYFTNTYGVVNVNSSAVYAESSVCNAITAVVDNGPSGFNDICAGSFIYNGSSSQVIGVASSVAPGGYGLLIYGLTHLNGNTQISGTASVSGYLTKSGGGFLVDHPQDPGNKMLNHCFVESPEMKNVYDGVVVLDSNGNATVALPSYFEAANSDFRYQLTAIGASMPNLFVSTEVSNNQFSVSGGVAGKKVSWQVTGVRADKWALANHPGVEITKKTPGTYLHPELFGEDSSKRVDHKGDVPKTYTPPSATERVAPTPPVR